MKGIFIEMENTIEKLKKPVDELFTRCYNLANTCIKYPKYRNVLTKNSVFKNKHKGERCFILGNGPSLNNINFSELSTEYIFTVNQLFKNPKFEELHTNYHIWSDPIFFDLFNEERMSKEYVNEFYKVNTFDNKPICFMPMQARKYIERFSIDKELNVNYIHTCLTFFDGIKRCGDFAKLVPSFSTVVINAIQLAIYMGFKEIYLLGCDCTGIVAKIEKEQGKTVNSYAYMMSERDVKLVDTDFEKAFKSWMKIFHQYKWVSRICNSQNIKLVNCTENSILNVIPYISLEKILGENRS